MAICLFAFMAFHSFPTLVGKNSGCDVAIERSIQSFGFLKLISCIPVSSGSTWIFELLPKSVPHCYMLMWRPSKVHAVTGFRIPCTEPQYQWTSLRQFWRLIFLKLFKLSLMYMYDPSCLVITARTYIINCKFRK